MTIGRYNRLAHLFHHLFRSSRPFRKFLSCKLLTKYADELTFRLSVRSFSRSVQFPLLLLERNIRGRCRSVLFEELPISFGFAVSLFLIFLSHGYSATATSSSMCTFAEGFFFQVMFSDREIFPGEANPEDRGRVDEKIALESKIDHPTPHLGEKKDQTFIHDCR